jgi:hypothetical protein
VVVVVLVEVVVGSVLLVASEVEDNSAAFSSLDPQPLRATTDMKMARVAEAITE